VIEFTGAEPGDTLAYILERLKQALYQMVCQGDEEQNGNDCHPDYQCQGATVEAISGHQQNGPILILQTQYKAAFIMIDFDQAACAEFVGMECQSCCIDDFSPIGPVQVFRLNLNIDL
jgi:hypothetical protein